MSKPALALQPPGADRRRADRLLDRACRARAGRGGLDRRHRPLGGDAQARCRTRARRSGGGDQRRGGRRRRPRHRLHSGRRLRRGRQGNRPASGAGRHRLRRRLGQGRGDPRHGAASAEDRAFRAGASGGRHRIFRPRRGLCRTVRQPLVHSDAAAWRRSDRRWKSLPHSGGCSAPMWRPWRRITTIWCSPSPAICRI